MPRSTATATPPPSTPAKAPRAPAGTVKKALLAGAIVAPPASPAPAAAPRPREMTVDEAKKRLEEISDYIEQVMGEITDHRRDKGAMADEINPDLVAFLDAESTREFIAHGFAPPLF